MQCPMIVVKGRKHKPEEKEIVERALGRATKQMNTTKGSTGVAGPRKASIEFPKLLREGSPAIINSIPEYSFFTFRVAAAEARYASEFLNYATRILNLPRVSLCASELLTASESFAELRALFMDCLQGKRKKNQLWGRLSEHPE